MEVTILVHVVSKAQVTAIVMKFVVVLEKGSKVRAPAVRIRTASALAKNDQFRAVRISD